MNTDQDSLMHSGTDLGKLALAQKERKAAESPTKNIAYEQAQGLSVEKEVNIELIIEKKDRNGIGCLSRKIRCFERRIGFC